MENIEDIITSGRINNNTENTLAEETSESEYKVVLSAENSWTHTFQDLPKTYQNTQSKDKK